MTGKSRARQAIKNLDITKKNVEYLIPGVLGLSIGGEKTVEVPGRPGYHYVRLRDNLSEVVHAYNAETSPVYGLPVLITKDSNDITKYVVVGRDTERYQNWGSSSFLPRHGAQHSFDRKIQVGGDIVWIFGDQFMPLNVTPSGSSASNGVVVNDYVWWDGTNDVWRWISQTGTSSLLGYKPTTFDQARLVLIYTDPETGILGYESGVEFSASVTGTPGVYTYLPDLPNDRYIPIYAVRLVTGTSVITWDNLYDVRPYFGSGGGSTITTGTFGNFTEGSVPFAGPAGTLTEDNDNLFFDDTNDRLIIGANSLPYTSSSRANVTKEGGSVGFDGLSYGGVVINSGFRANDTEASPSTILKDEGMFWISAGAFDGVDWTGLRAALRTFAAETWSPSGRGTYIDFLVTATGSSTATVAEKIWKGLHEFSGDIQLTGTARMSGFQMDVGAVSGYVLKSDANGIGTWQASAGGGTGSSSFLDLSDTPSSYSGLAGYLVAVNEAEDALEFRESTGSSVDTDELVKVSSNDTTSGYLEDKLIAGPGIGIVVNDDGSNESITISVTGSFGSVTGSVTAFLELTDTPPAYGGFAGYLVTVNDAENALEFREGTGSSSTDELVKVSSNDTTPGYLEDKLIGSTGTSVVVINEGGNEQIVISVTGSSVTGGASTFLELTDTPSSYSGESGSVVQVLNSEDGLEFTTPIEISSNDANILSINFLEQSAAPAAPASGHRIIYTSSTGTFERDSFGTIRGPFSEIQNFLDLPDTPSSYSGQFGKVPSVNVSEDGLEFISITGSGGGGYTEGCRIFNNANISIPNNSQTALTFNSEDYDSDAMHDLVSNTGRITIKTAGIYIVTFNGRFAANSTGHRYCVIRLNGTTGICFTNNDAVSTLSTTLNPTIIRNFSVNDYLTIEVYQNSGGALNIEYQTDQAPYFMVQRIG